MGIRGDLPFLFTLLAVAAGLWVYPRLAELRPLGSVEATASALVVTSPADSGPGSLRDAVFRALRSSTPSVVVLRVREVRLTTPLPPIGGPQTFVMRSEGSTSTIHAPPDVMDVPVLDLRGGPAIVENVAIRGAAGSAIGVSTRNPVRLTDMVVADSAIGLSAAEGHRLEVVSGRFVANRIGIELLGAGSATITAVTFEGQEDAGIWAVGPAARGGASSALEVVGSTFRGSRYGVVAANVDARLRDNEIDSSADDGIIALAGTLTAVGNRIHRGAGTGIRSSGLRDGWLARNEVFGNAALGILVETTRKATVEANDIYRNGYGIVTLRNESPSAVTLERNIVVAHGVDGIVAIGDSPVIVDNRSLRNTSAGIRILHLDLIDGYVLSSPLLSGNVLDGNSSDEPIFDVYRLRDPAAAGASR